MKKKMTYQEAFKIVEAHVEQCRINRVCPSLYAPLSKPDLDYAYKVVIDFYRREGRFLLLIDSEREKVRDLFGFYPKEVFFSPGADSLNITDFR